MLRLAAIFIATCMVLIAASLGAVGYLVFGLSGTEASLIALATMSGLALYNTVTARLHDRDHVGKQDCRSLAWYRGPYASGRGNDPPSNRAGKS